MSTMTAPPATWPRIATGRRYEVRQSGEVRIYEGFGRVEEAALKAGARNGHVSINAEHLQRPVKGWCDASSPIWPIVEGAHQSGARVAYQVILERKRPKAGEQPIDPSIPIEQLDHQSQTTSKVEFVYVVNGAGEPIDTPPPGWAPEAAGTPSAATAPPPAPAAPTPERPTPERQSGSDAQAATPPRAEAPAQEYFPQPPDGPPLCPLCGKTTVAAGNIRKHQATGRFAHLEPCLTGQPPAATDQEPTTSEPAPEARRGPRMAEAKPWERVVPGTDILNLGCYAVKASMDMVVLAQRLLREYRAAAGEALPPPPEHVKLLAARLLQAADRCQELIRPDGHVDRNDFSHNRCRDAVKVAIEDFPVPFDADPAQRQALRDQWVTKLADYAAALVRAAIELDR